MKSYERLVKNEMGNNLRRKLIRFQVLHNRKLVRLEGRKALREQAKESEKE